MKNYNATWSRSLIIVSCLVSALCLGIAVGMISSRHGIPPWVALIPVTIVVGGALFTIRGYTVAPDALLVHRLFWATRLPLAGLQSARVEPNAMRRSIRLLGNGGLFAFSGLFRNKHLGVYRAFVTDLHRTVVLRFPTRAVVVSPSPPEEFVREIAGGTVSQH